MQTTGSSLRINNIPGTSAFRSNRYGHDAFNDTQFRMLPTVTRLKGPLNSLLAERLILQLRCEVIVWFCDL